MFPPPFIFPSQTEGEQTHLPFASILLRQAYHAPQFPPANKGSRILQVALIRCDLIFLKSRAPERYTALPTDMNGWDPPPLHHAQPRTQGSAPAPQLAATGYGISPRRMQTGARRQGTAQHLPSPSAAPLEMLNTAFENRPCTKLSPISQGFWERDRCTLF